MNTKLYLTLLLGLLALTLGRPALLRAEARPQLPPEAAKVAQDFVAAFSRNDRGTITKLLPRQLRNFYGPSPFSRVPTLTKPRADKRMGVIEFQGGGADKGLPERGMIMLRRVTTEGKHTAWRIRQIYWYDELPRDARIPQESLTAADKREEPRITEAAREFLRTWVAQDYEKLHEQVFHWWEISREAPKWVKLNRVILRDTGDSMGATRVNFTAKLRLLGALSRDVDGTLWLVHEDGQWRVRPLTVAFVF